MSLASVTVTFSTLAMSSESAAAADSVEVANVVKVVVTEAADIELTLLFDPEHDLEERILKEQFAP